MHHLAIFASGTGSNAVKMIEHFEHNPEISVSVVVSNKPGAPVLAKAAELGVATELIDKKAFFESDDILKLLEKYGVDFVVLAGFLWLVPASLVRAYDRRMVNIHPALLPKFGGKGMYGMHVHRAVKQAGERHSGITIHFVNEHYDQGDIVFQATCPVLQSDTPEDIASKVQRLEHHYYPLVVEQLLTRLPKPSEVVAKH